MKKLNCLSIYFFNIIMEKIGLYKDTSNLPEDIAIISICEPEDNRGNDYPKRYFTNNHKNILTQDFDDIDADMHIWDNFYRTDPERYIVYQGQLLRPFTDQQADEMVNFIISNLGKTFFIHCYAGVSRSKAVTKFIFDTFDEYSVDDCPQWKDPEIPNKYVIKKLNEAYKRYIKKHL